MAVDSQLALPVVDRADEQDNLEMDDSFNLLEIVVFLRSSTVADVRLLHESSVG